MTIKKQKIATGNNIARTLKKLGSPEVGKLAYDFWSMLNSFEYFYDMEVVAQLYLKAGYLPFSGYPLVRHNQ